MYSFYHIVVSTVTVYVLLLNRDKRFLHGDVYLTFIEGVVSVCATFLNVLLDCDVFASEYLVEMMIVVSNSGLLMPPH